MYVSRKDFMLRVSIVFVLFICTIFNEIPFFSYLSFAMFILFMYMLVVRSPFLLLKYPNFIISISGFILGCTLCEFSNVNLFELAEFAHYVGSLPLIITLYIIFLLSLAFLDGLIQDYQSKLPEQNYSHKMKQIWHYASLLSVMIFIVLFLKVARNPAFVMGYDKASYQRLFNLDSGVFKYLGSITPVILTFTIIDYYNGYKKTGMLGMVLYILYYLWIGHKFGAFFKFFTVFVMARYDSIIKMSQKKLTKYICVFVAVILCILPITGLLAINMSGGGILEDYLLWRVTAQGQLWWKTFEVSKETHMNEFHNEIDAIFIDNSVISTQTNANYGMYKIMYLCGKDNYVKMRLQGGSVYTESGYASAYYYFGAAGGVIYAVFFAFLFAITRNAISRAIRRATLIRLVVFIRVFNLLFASMATFSFHSFVKPTSILGWVIIIVGALYDRSVKKNIPELKPNHKSN